MIQLLTELDRGECANCDGAIRLLQGDLERAPRWSHDVNGRPECPGAPTARPKRAADPSARDGAGAER